MNLNQIKENLSETLNQLQSQNFSMVGMIDELYPSILKEKIDSKNDMFEGGIIGEIEFLARQIQTSVNIMKENQENLRKIVYGELGTAQSYMTVSKLEDMRGRYL